MFKTRLHQRYCPGDHRSCDHHQRQLPVSGGTLFLVSLIGLTELYRTAGVQEKDFSPVWPVVGALGVAAYYAHRILLPDLRHIAMTVLMIAYSDRTDGRLCVYLSEVSMRIR